MCPQFQQDECHDHIVSDGVVVRLENAVQHAEQIDLFMI